MKVPTKIKAKNCLYFFLPLLCLVCFLSLFTLTTSAEQSNTTRHIYDMADLLGDSEEASLESEARQLSTKLNADIVVITTLDWNAHTSDMMRACGYGTMTDCVALVVFYDGAGSYEYEVGAYGGVYVDGEVVYLNEQELDSISDKFYDEIKRGDIAEGASLYFRAVQSSAKWTKGNLRGWLRSAAFGGVFGLVAAIVFFVVIRSRYLRKLKSSIYPLEKFSTLDLTKQEDLFLGSHVTRVVISSNTGHRGGSHGSRGGSRGGFRGGGRR